MAMANTFDPGEVQARLEDWLRSKLPEASSIKVGGVEVPASSGMSNNIVLFDLSYQDGDGVHAIELVARIQPSGPGVFLTYDLAREFALMSALNTTAIPVPTVRWSEPDPAPLGAPFMIMDRVRGRIAGDDPPFTAAGWVTELTPDQRATVYDNGLQTLAAIHALDWEGLGLEFLDRPELGPGGIRQVLTHYERTYAWAAGAKQYPVVAAALRWAWENVPVETRTVLCHGDARLANLVFPDDLSVAAVLDWELAVLGSPEFDLGWWQFVMRHHTDGIGIPLPEGFPTAEQTVARYEELTGHTVTDLHFYEVVAAIFLSVTMIQVANVLRSAGLVPEGDTMDESNPASHILATLLELPPPDSTSSTFIGKR